MTHEEPILPDEKVFGTRANLPWSIEALRSAPAIFVSNSR